MKPLEGYQVEREGSHAVALELEIDDELRDEGWAREIVHAVQIARQQAGLEVTDRIALTLDGDEELIGAARAHEGYIAGETLAVEVSYESLERRRRPGHDRRAIAAGRRGAGVALAGVRRARARARPRACASGTRRSRSWPAGRGGTGSASGST